MDVIVLAVALDQISFEVAANLGKNARQVSDGQFGQGVATVFGDKHQVGV